jgi:(2Fe-2S) ferredoxin
MALDIFDRPAADRRLLVCTGPCCDRLGHASVHLEALRQELMLRGLAGAAADPAAGVDAASCVKRSCLGKCTGEPLVLVKPDNVWYQGLSGEDLIRIYEQHVVNRQPVAELVFAEGEE